MDSKYCVEVARDPKEMTTTKENRKSQKQLRDDYIQILTTVEKREDAQRITRKVLEKRLAACCQILGPIKSTYWWKGKIETADEWLCILKSKKELYPALERTIKEIHPYETREIIAIPIIAGLEGYLSWLDDELKGRNAGA